jgi:hypothetical protein
MKDDYELFIGKMWKEVVLASSSTIPVFSRRVPKNFMKPQ